MYNGPNIEAIHSTLFGELMFHRVLNNTDTVTVHRHRGESNTKVS
jgi:hypothetical protein